MSADFANDCGRGQGGKIWVVKKRVINVVVVAFCHESAIRITGRHPMNDNAILWRQFKKNNIPDTKMGWIFPRRQHNVIDVNLWLHGSAYDHADKGLGPGYPRNCDKHHKNDPKTGVETRKQTKSTHKQAEMDVPHCAIAKIIINYIAKMAVLAVADAVPQFPSNGIPQLIAAYVAPDVFMLILNGKKHYRIAMRVPFMFEGRQRVIFRDVNPGKATHLCMTLYHGSTDHNPLSLTSWNWCGDFCGEVLVNGGGQDDDNTIFMKNALVSVKGLLIEKCLVSCTKKDKK